MTVRDVACVSVRAVGAASTQGPSPSTRCRHCDAGQPLPLPEKPALQQRDNDGAERAPQRTDQQRRCVHSERVALEGSCVDCGLDRCVALGRACEVAFELRACAPRSLQSITCCACTRTSHGSPSTFRPRCTPGTSPSLTTWWTVRAVGTSFPCKCCLRTCPTWRKAQKLSTMLWTRASGSQTSLFHWSYAQTTGSRCEGNVAGAARLALRSARAAWRQRRD